MRTSPPFDPTPPPERPSGLAEFTSTVYIMFPLVTSISLTLSLVISEPLQGGSNLACVSASCPPLPPSRLGLL